MPERETVCRLQPYSPSQRCIGGIEVKVQLSSNMLCLRYSLAGELTKLLLPPLGEMKRSDGLWQHTCFEAFIQPVGEQRYFEFNFSPSREWAAYAFRAYRERIVDEVFNPQLEIVVQTTAEQLVLDATILLNVLRNATRLRVGLSAVIEADDGTLSYWALKHPAAKPDFHHPDSFVLELALPTANA